MQGDPAYGCSLADLTLLWKFFLRPGPDMSHMLFITFLQIASLMQPRGDDDAMLQPAFVYDGVVHPLVGPSCPGTEGPAGIALGTDSDMQHFHASIAT